MQPDEALSRVTKPLPHGHRSEPRRSAFLIDLSPAVASAVADHEAAVADSHAAYLAVEDARQAVGDLCRRVKRAAASAGTDPGDVPALLDEIDTAVRAYDTACLLWQAADQRRSRASSRWAAAQRDALADPSVTKRWTDQAWEVYAASVEAARAALSGLRAAVADSRPARAELIAALGRSVDAAALSNIGHATALADTQLPLSQIDQSLRAAGAARAVIDDHGLRISRTYMAIQAPGSEPAIPI